MLSRLVAYNALHVGTSAGIGRHAFELLRNILEIDPPFKFLVIIDERNKHRLSRYMRAKDKLHIVPAIKNGRQRILWEQIYLLPTLNKVDLVHNPDFLAPLLVNKPTIATIHDIAFLRTPETYTLYTRIWRQFFFRLSILKAKRIICVSNFTAREIRKYLNVPQAKIRVVQNGVTFFPSGTPTDDFVLDKFNIDLPYILCVNTVEPRKNIVNIIRAFKMLKEMGIEIKLVISGKLGWLYEPIFQEVKRLSLENEVVFTGFVSNRQLKALYAHALFLAYVPLYEGFGFPPLEAMSLGIPVLLSDISPLHEVAGEAGIYVDPQNPSQIAEGMDLLATDIDLRKDLVKFGKAQIKKFSWKNSAVKMINIYKEILS